MKSYAEFCRHYELASSAESRKQYQAFRDSLATLMAAIRCQPASTQTTPAIRPKS